MDTQFDFPLDRPPWWRPIARWRWDKTMRMVRESYARQPPELGPYR